MIRHAAFSLTAGALLGLPLAAGAQPGSATPPLTYELIINGESFLIEANRLVKLQSKQSPETSYQVALRVAPTQRLRLNSVQLEYDWLAKVEDDRKPRQRSVRLTHELGFSMLITDLGQELPPDALSEALKIVTDSVTQSFRRLKIANLEVGDPRESGFAGTTGMGVMIRYRDEQDLDHTCLVYVLTGPKFAVSCVVQYVNRDFEDAKPLLKKTLDSFRPLSAETRQETPSPRR